MQALVGHHIEGQAALMDGAARYVAERQWAPEPGLATARSSSSPQEQQQQPEPARVQLAAPARQRWPEEAPEASQQAPSVSIAWSDDLGDVVVADYRPREPASRSRSARSRSSAVTLESSSSTTLESSASAAAPAQPPPPPQQPPQPPPVDLERRLESMEQQLGRLTELLIQREEGSRSRQVRGRG